MKRIKFKDLLNFKPTSVDELFSYVLFLQYQHFGDLLFLLISLCSSFCLYVELDITVFSAVIIFSCIMIIKFIIDFFLDLYFHKRLIMERNK